MPLRLTVAGAIMVAGVIRVAAADLATGSQGGVVHPSPSCLLNGFPCPPPDWPAVWNLAQSTYVFPSDEPAATFPPFDPVHPWGMVQLDWAVGGTVWLKPDRNQSDCEAQSIANCVALKANGTAQRCLIYHNMELALQWLESNRAVMYDPTKADWFLQYTDGLGHKNGTIYNDHRSEGDQYFIDWRNADAAAYFVSAIVAVSTSNPAVDGTHTDDREGLPNEHPTIAALLNMSAADMAALEFATQAGGQYLVTSLAANNKTCTDCLAGAYLANAPQPHEGSSCAPAMRRLCEPGMQSQSMFFKFDGSNATLAAFLVARSPLAYIGFQQESNDNSWSPLFELDVGIPLGLCSEGPAGVFTRNWSKGTAEIDCNTWNGTLPFSK